MFVLAFLVWVFVRDYPHQRGYADYQNSDSGSERQTFKETLLGIPQVFRYRNVLLLFLIPGGLVGGVLTFAGLWGIPYLTAEYGLSKPQAAALTSTLMVAMAVGSPASGWLSDRLGRRKPLYMLWTAAALVGWVLLIYVPDLSMVTVLALLIVTGFSSGVVVLSFAFAKETVPPSLAGTVSGVVNTGVMMGPMLLQPAVGWILDTRWEGGIAEGVRVYGSASFQAGFSLMVAWLGLSLLLLFFTRETHCKQQRVAGRL